MSLATIVHFAQTNFGAPSTSTKADGSSESSELAPAFDVIPEWIRNRRPEDEAPGGDGHNWKIHSAVAPPLPLPNVDRVGPDALAFYVPFHLYRDDWGIYIRDVGVKYLACGLKGGPLVPGDEECLDEAERVLLDHEFWHAATEIACTRAEMFARTALYRPYFASPSAREHEEALANAHAVRMLAKSGSPFLPQVEAWMSRLGAGYRDFARFRTSAEFSRGKEAAARFMSECLPKPGPRVAGEPLQFLYRGANMYRSMPVRRLLDSAAVDATVVRPFPREHGLQVFVYSNDHPPPHFHIKCLSNGDETRYLWRSLKPYAGDFRLTGKDAKAFGRYWAAHEQEIVDKLRAVYT